MKKGKAQSDSFAEFIADQLSDVPVLRIKPMFGGHGVFTGSIMFGILYQGRLYFKVDDVTRKQYEQAGMKPLQPPKMDAMRSYYEVPADSIESPADLIDLARQSIAIAKKAKKK